MIKAIIVSTVLLASGVVGSSQLYKVYRDKSTTANTTNNYCFSPEGKYSIKSVKKSGDCAEIGVMALDATTMQGAGVIQQGCQGTVQMSSNNCFVISDSTCHVQTCPGYTPDQYVRRQAITTWTTDGNSAKETLVGSIVNGASKIICSSVYEVVYERAVENKK